MTFTQLLEKYRENANSNRNQGDRFELLIKRYLKIKPEFRSQLKDVWLWSEFPYKSQFGTGGKDTGIDIVCRTNIDEYWAVQCKFFDAKKTITLDDISTFVTTSSLDFDANGVKKKFSHRIWIDTTQNGFNAEAQNYANKLHICRLGRFDLEKDDIDWESLDKGQISDSAHKKKYDLRAHQKSAFDDIIAYFKDENNTRGRLIMACGTGKTFTSLRIAEEMAGKGRGLVLFLVPSIALLSQSLKEWCAQSKDNIYPICICSDSKASNVKYDESISDLALPASTDRDVIYNNFIKYQQLKDKNGGLIVVFSTYQSIDVISSVQAEINKIDNDSFVFDLIICDEAHRTTGVEQVGKEKSSFTKVHDANFIKADKRLYMTATPRLYSSDVKKTAKDAEITLCSMDDESIYGKEVHRIGFGEAVSKGLLSDYKVIVLTLDENSVDEKVRDKLNEKVKESIKKHKFKNEEINADDVTKIIGCINVLSKRTKFLTDRELFRDDDPTLMKSAVAFCSSIKNSEYLKESFNLCRESYYDILNDEEKENMVIPSADHIDGSMDSNKREEKLAWLRSAKNTQKDCHILNNVRCLSEGVDVPSLDAVMFLSTRNSQVDVVQSVGRVMRKAEGKKFGYIIIPVVVPSNSDVDEILSNNADFKTVWSVLNALRAHDDRFNAWVNKIELNTRKP